MIKAKDEWCDKCKSMHPKYLDGSCPDFLKVKKTTRIIIESDVDEIDMYDKFKELGVNFIDIHVMYCSFKEFMDEVHIRNTFKSDRDTYFGYHESFINSRIFEIHDYWEAGMSPYKALTFLSI
jgi:hypothetical protein